MTNNAPQQIATRIAGAVLCVVSAPFLTVMSYRNRAGSDFKSDPCCLRFRAIVSCDYSLTPHERIRAVAGGRIFGHW